MGHPSYNALAVLWRHSMRSFAVAFALCAVLSVAGMAAPQDAEKRTPAQILDAMLQTYQNCKTYSDTGIVKTTFIEAYRTRSTEKPFRTVFVRPSRFRFEFTEDMHGRSIRYIVWRDGEKVKTWWDIGSRLEDQPSLDLALAGATGVSAGSAHTVPALLMPSEVSGFTLKNLLGITRLNDSTCGDSKCFLIRGKDSQGDILTLWIDKSSLLLRQIHSGHDFAGFQTEEITTYTPMVNDRISEEMTAFSAPNQSK
jgi:hypothetical protein